MEEALQMLQIKKGVGKFYHCPLHPDLHPSLEIMAQTNSWRCHQCKAGGNPLTLLRLAWKLDKFEALQKYLKLSGRAVPSVSFGVIDELPLRELPEEKPKPDTELYDFFWSLLTLDDSATGYLESRAIPREIAERYDTRSISNPKLVESALRERFTTDRLLASKLFAEKGRRSWLIFPRCVIWRIADPNGATLGFVSRNLGGKIKSFKTTSYPLVSDWNAGKWFVVESPIDGISAHILSGGKVGFISSNGLPTPRQISELGLPTKKMVLALDQDAAGIATTQKMVRAFPDMRVLHPETYAGAKDANEALINKKL
jgi:DNA primase